MLSIMHPEVMRKVYALSIGLIPFTVKADSIPKLIIKASKETILIAKVRQGFSIFLIPYATEGKSSIGFLAAFFDNNQHPLTTGGALIKELGGRELSKLFISPQVDVHFFDELGHELLAYRAELTSTKKHRELLRSAVLPSIQGLNQSAILSSLRDWFSKSTYEDDAAAISVKFTQPLMPDDLVYFDMREENNSYHGSLGYHEVFLEREEPGAPQEREIINLLSRTFSPECIYLAPKRTYDKEEIVDILVVTESSVLLIQAKDSPNIERIVNNTIFRKRTTTDGAIKKAVGQVKGAIGYMKKSSPMTIVMGCELKEIEWEGKNLYSLVVIKELFDDSYSGYTSSMIELFRQTNIPCIPLSYSELHQYTHHIKTEKEFFAAFMTVFSHGHETGAFPRLRMVQPT